MKPDLQEHLEACRQEEQARLDALKDTVERNRLGQFATPYPLAREIAQLAMSLWKDNKKKIRFLDPGFGTGVFYSALRNEVPEDKIASARGIEVDPVYAGVARRLWEPLGAEIIESDFTKLLAPPPSLKANLIICNPPYIRHHHLSKTQKKELKKEVHEATGLALNGLAGMYCYFLMLSHRWLAPRGLALWLIPTEFMEVNYGETIREYLADIVTLRRVHRFEPADVQFVDALVSSAVVVYENMDPPEENETVFTVGGTLHKPKSTYSVKRSWLTNERKWTRRPQSTPKRSRKHEKTISFGDLFRTRRGVATGANAFFILNLDDAVRRGIPERFLTPILPGPKLVENGVIESDDKGFPLLSTTHVLIDCGLEEERVHDEYPSLWQYFEEGKKQSIHRRYLTSRREPWYRQEQIEPAPYVCSYMGRNKAHLVPFRFFWNKSQAITSNVYHLIYPLPHVEALSKNNPEIPAALFQVLNQISIDELILQGRTYGGGLYKIEPKELHRVTLTDIPLARDISSATMLF
jgi:adenine-specific DNA-methyltransferase